MCPRTHSTACTHAPQKAELCYAPQFGSAKDPVNIVGMVAANVLRGDHPVAHWDDDGGEWQVAAAKAEGALIVDVREVS